MKLMPASRAAWMIRTESAWSVLPHEPNIIAPRHSGLTETPVRPSRRRSISGGRTARSSSPPYPPAAASLQLAMARIPPLPRRGRPAPGAHRARAPAAARGVRDRRQRPGLVRELAALRRRLPEPGPVRPGAPRAGDPAGLPHDAGRRLRVGPARADPARRRRHRGAGRGARERRARRAGAGRGRAPGGALHLPGGAASAPPTRPPTPP